MNKAEKPEFEQDLERLMFALYHEPFPEYEWTEQKIRELITAGRKAQKEADLKEVALVKIDRELPVYKYTNFDDDWDSAVDECLDAIRNQGDLK